MKIVTIVGARPQFVKAAVVSRVFENYNVKFPDQVKIYDLMIGKFNHAVAKRNADKPEFYDKGTLIIEMARGREDAYRKVMGLLSPEILNSSAIFYVEVDFEESWRRNVARYQEKLKHSSLAHMAPRETMELFYKVDDWKEITKGQESGKLTFQGIDIPFVTMNNTPELKDREPLAERYKPHLDKLFELYKG